ncbi:MAG TPA: DUF4097 family beta strand repeat-containing protein [Acidimicrobiia bacterium]|nr:DUF4097 family beta strand repeat-containing protein [Acidimicrobiia bacterium]
MKRNSWRVVGVVLVVAGLAGLVFPPLMGSTSDMGSQSFSDATVVEFDLSNSPVEFRTGGQGEVVVEYTFSTGFLRAAGITIDQTDDVLRFEQTCPSFFSWGCQASFDVSVPAGVGVAGSTSNGSIVLSGLAGPVDVGTSNGPVTLEDVSADSVVVSTSNGAIRGEGLGSDEFDVETSNGRITLSFDVAPRSVSARSSNGAIELSLPGDAPPYAMDTSTSNGTVDTDIRTDPAAPLSISLRTSNGDITVGYLD